jgi:hypothetical protein
LSSRRAATVATVDRFESDDVEKIAFGDAVGGVAGLGQFHDVNAVSREQGHLRVAHLVGLSVGPVKTERLEGVLPKRFAQLARSPRTRFLVESVFDPRVLSKAWQSRRCVAGAPLIRRHVR